MIETEALTALAALSQETRLRIFRLLLRSSPQGLSAGAIAEAVGSSASNLSFHLAQLERAGLVAGRREARSIIYAVRPERAAALVEFLGADVGEAPVSQVAAARAEHASSRPRNVLFLCSGNSARSIMAEAILRKDGGGRFAVFSAGSRPREEAHPLALEVLAAHGYPAQDLHPKDWLAFAAADAPPIDLAITLCDTTTGETCPHWPGDPLSAHWGIADPAAVDGPLGERRTAFVAAFRFLQRRIAALLALPLDELDPLALCERLSAIGTMEGASIKAIVPFARRGRARTQDIDRKARAS